MKTEEKSCVGIVGGAGPLASAEFLKTIYEYSVVGRREQETPVVLMYSDPTFPDRTDAFLRADEESVLAPLVAALDALAERGAARVVICCMTMHHLLPRLPRGLRARVVSMLDVIFDNLPPRPSRHLVFCSTGTRRFRLFERHPRWAEFQECVVFPDEEDQRRIHDEIIYPIKRNPALGPFAAEAETLLAKYGADSFVAGCSEMHILAKHLKAAGRDAYARVDPLDIIARGLAEGRI